MDSNSILRGLIRFTQVRDGLKTDPDGEYIEWEQVVERLESYDYDIKSKIKEFINGL